MIQMLFVVILCRADLFFLFDLNTRVCTLNYYSPHLPLG